jgi:DNA-binding GntR family transcriptional regulator
MGEMVDLQLGIDLAKRRPLRDEAYDVLRRAILTGAFKPGDRVVEREVCERLGLSRSPVREAFRRLEQEGLVVVSRQGLVVQTLSIEEVAELYQIRQQLEAMVARLAAQRCCAEQREELQAILAGIEQAIATDKPEMASGEGVRFHEKLAEIAGNRRLAGLLTGIGEEIQRFRNLYVHIPSRSQNALEEHRLIMEAVCAGDAERAAQVMFEHIGRALIHIQSSQYGGVGRMD